MRVKALEKIKATSSLTFVAGTLVMHMFVSGIWVSLPLQVVERLTGLFLSYLIIISFAKRWWHRRILAYERALAKSDDGAKSFELMPIELQKMLVDHLHFAVVTFDGQLKIRLETPAFPKSLSDIDDLDGRDLIEMLGLVTRLDTDDLQMLRFQLCHVFGMNKIQWLATSLSLPQEAQLQRSATAYVRLRYIPVYKMEKLARIHLILQDFTEVKEREVNAEMQRKNMEKLFALLQVSDSLFDLFMSETRKLFEDIKFDLKSLREKSSRDSQETANRMFRAVHPIKANAKLFKLNSIQDVAHTVENYLEELRQGKRHFTSAVLVELTQKIMTISEEVYSYASLRKEILNRSDRGASFNIKYRVQWIRSLMNQFASILRDPNFDRRHLKLIHKEFSRALSSFDKASLCEYIPGYNTMLQELAFSLGKELDEISVDLQCHHFDSTTLARINDILLHCLRNAVDHGIETPEQREAKGKSRKGQIRLKTMEKDGTVVIELSDNGRGIDLDRIKAKAIDMKLLTADQADQLT
ncbi:MAG: Hpt domain-containing protein [Proteobacteria bacterium]|nr:Hpt domain-containing protein [Pseudomonadota bacterium]